jgi:MFS family permease
LLDGLDEVAPEHREECVEAINTFRRRHGQVSLAVCCRAADYQVLSVRVELSGAVAIEPLSREQVSTYLKQAGKLLAGVRTALRDDEMLWELLDTPLMLSIVTLAYQGRSAAEVRATGSLEERRAHLFENYTERMFERRTKVIEYTRAQTIHWLSWLARILVRNNLSMLYVERMQPDWSLARKQKWVVILATIALEAFIGLVLGLGAGLIAGLGLLLAFDLNPEIRFIVPSIGLQGGLGGVLTGMLVDYIYGHRITPAESLRWSWTAARSKLDYTLIIGTGVACGLLFGVAQAVFVGLSAGLIHGPVVGSVIGLAFWLVRGTVTDRIPTRTKPNEGIQRSLKSALISFLAVGLVGGLIYGLIYGLIQGLIYGPVAGLKIVLILGSAGIMMFGMIGGLTNGGHAYIKHYVLRILLWRNNFSPRNHIRFLDYAAERIFLRKIGGGYIFIHRLLMEYFATLEPTGQTQQTPSTVPDHTSAHRP